VFISAVPIIKLFAWGEGDSGGHALRETTSRGLCRQRIRIGSEGRRERERLPLSRHQFSYTYAEGESGEVDVDK
jgi:hypothetical protein